MFILYLITFVLGIRVFIESFNPARGTEDEKFRQNIAWLGRLAAFLICLGLSAFMSL